MKFRPSSKLRWQGALLPSSWKIKQETMMGEELLITTARPSSSKGLAYTMTKAEGSVGAVFAADVCSPASVSYMSITSSCHFMACSWNPDAIHLSGITIVLVSPFHFFITHFIWCISICFLEQSFSAVCLLICSYVENTYRNWSKDWEDWEITRTWGVLLNKVRRVIEYTVLDIFFLLHSWHRLFFSLGG